MAVLEGCAGRRPAELQFKVGDLEALVAGQPTLVEQSTATIFYKAGGEIRYRCMSVR